MPVGVSAPGTVWCADPGLSREGPLCLGLDGSGWCGARRATHLEEELMYLNDDRRVLLGDEDQGWRGWYSLPGELAAIAGPERLPALLSEFEGWCPGTFREGWRPRSSRLVTTRTTTASSTTRRWPRTAGGRWTCAPASTDSDGRRGWWRHRSRRSGSTPRGYPQATLFVHARFHRVPAITGVREMTVGQYSAILADEHARESGFLVHQGLLGQYWIWSSTLGAASEQAQGMGLSRIRPAGVFGLIMRVSDGHDLVRRADDRRGVSLPRLVAERTPNAIPHRSLSVPWTGGA